MKYPGIFTVETGNTIRITRSKPDSFLNNHQTDKHEGAEADFSFNILKSFKDPLSRYIYEGVQIRRATGEVLNSKLEYYQQATKNSKLFTRQFCQKMSIYSDFKTLACMRWFKRSICSQFIAPI